MLGGRRIEQEVSDSDRTEFPASRDQYILSEVQQNPG